MISQSIGTGRVWDGEGELSFHANSNATVVVDASVSNNGSSNSGVRQRLQNHGSSSQAGEESDVAIGIVPGNNEDSKPLADSSIIGFEEPIMLTQSTHSFLFTEPTFSLPFNFALVIISISYICLLLALINVLYEDFTPDNPFNVPVGVSTEVKIAQYLALLIGLIMEEEIPESLYLLRMITEKTLHQREPDLKYGKFIFCAVLRFIMVCRIFTFRCIQYSFIDRETHIDHYELV